MGQMAKSNVHNKCLNFAKFVIIHLIIVYSCRTIQTLHPVVLLEGAEGIHGDDGEEKNAGGSWQTMQVKVVRVDGRTAGN